MPEQGRESYRIADLAQSQRPRERLEKLGASALSDAELLAILIRVGVPGENAVELGQRLLINFDGLSGIHRAAFDDVCQQKGIGPAKAAQIKATFELSRRLENSLIEPDKITVKSPEDVIGKARALLKGKKKEHFVILCLDTRNHLIKTDVVSIGSLDCSIVHPREVFKEAISSSAASVIFVHNHPSGDPTPSEDDIKMTKRLIEAGEIIGIEVLDHIVICDKEHLSMKAKNLV